MTHPLCQNLTRVETSSSTPQAAARLAPVLAPEGRRQPPEQLPALRSDPAAFRSCSGGRQPQAVARAAARAAARRGAGSTAAGGFAVRRGAPRPRRSGPRGQSTTPTGCNPWANICFSTLKCSARSGALSSARELRGAGVAVLSSSATPTGEGAPLPTRAPTLF